jgi:hypothetical protein
MRGRWWSSWPWDSRETQLRGRLLAHGTTSMKLHSYCWMARRVAPALKKVKKKKIGVKPKYGEYFGIFYHTVSSCAHGFSWFILFKKKKISLGRFYPQ